MSKHVSEKAKRRDLTVIIALICALVIAAVIFVFMSNGNSNPPDNTDPQTDPQSSTEETTENLSTEANTSETEDSTEDESTAEDGTDTPQTTNPPYIPDTDYNYNGVEPGVAEELSALSRSVFIGDSRTEGLRLYTPLASSGSRIYAGTGMMVNNILTEPMFPGDDGKVTLPEALSADPDFDSVYIMLGINELGWVYTQKYIDGYAAVIDAVRAANPQAKIYVQSLIPVAKSVSDVDPVFNNQRIEEYNKALSVLCADKGVHYLNVAEIFDENGGALPEEAASDGIHLSKTYCDMWLDYILNHRA